MADMSKNNQFLFRGPAQILNVLSSLPLSEHDPFSFKIDLIYYTVSTF